MVFFAISLLKTLFRPIFDYLVTKLQYTEEIMFQCPTKINKERFLYLLSHFLKYTDKRKSRSLIYFKLWLQLKYMKRVISRFLFILYCDWKLLSRAVANAYDCLLSCWEIKKCQDIPIDDPSLKTVCYSNLRL